MKIIVLDGYGLNPGDLSWDGMEALGELKVYDRTSPSELLERSAGAEVLITNKTLITADDMEALPQLKYIGVLATGYNVVDCQATRKRGIPVCNVPDYGTAAVAQFTFALLLELCHQVGHHNVLVHQGKWCSCPNFCFWDTPQMELAGKTIGIIGFGQIGQSVGRIAQAMGMNVLAYSRSERPEGKKIGQYVDLTTLLSRSDVISLHCPLFPETTRLINQETLARMKDGAILLNTSRGAVIDEAAVAKALKSGKLGGAAMDVVSEEPMLESNPLLTAPNCIITPHISGNMSLGLTCDLDVEMFLEDFRRYEAGEPLKNLVDRERGY